jgi:3D-(3,5/4)-trihydroxycyclohexane-1,2-dione acylhydrolase (decyclizing)
MATIRLTMVQALARYLCAQSVEIDGEELPLFAGVWAIFGHGNVAGLGEALYAVRDRLPILRAHNEQAMAHAAIAFAKAHRRRRIMACTSSIGPGATNGNRGSGRSCQPLAGVAAAGRYFCQSAARSGIAAD